MQWNESNQHDFPLIWAGRVKILVYSHYFAPSIGGVEVIVQSLATNLAKRTLRDGTPEFKVTVVANTPQGDFDDLSFPFSIVRKPNIFQLSKLIQNCNILHLAGPALLPLLLAKAFRRKVVVEHHGYQAICLNGSLLQEPIRNVCPGYFQAWKFGRCLKCRGTDVSFLASMKDLLLTTLRHVLCRYGTENIGITKHVMDRHRLPHTQVIYYGIEDPLATYGPNVPKDLGKKDPSTKLEKPVNFAYVGRLVQEKGIPILLEAAGKLRFERHDFEVLLVGDGPERANLETQIRRTGLTGIVKITGFLRDSGLKELLDTVQVVVMPSVWEETAGLSAIEHMMRGRLVIASNIGGLGEVVDHAGILFPPGDVAALVDCMRQVLANPAMLDEMGRKARKRALDVFTRERMMDEHVRLYNSVARRST